MILFHEKGIDAIKQAAERSKVGLICTPYYSERGLSLLDPFFDAAEKVDFWTRFSPLDWKAGVADMAALTKRVQSLLERKQIFEFRVSDDLHAKIYKFSDDKVLIGSANLTWPAMTSNIETVCELTEESASSILDVLKKFEQRLIHVEAEVLVAYVDLVGDVVSKPFDGPVDEDEDMNKAIELAEEELKKALVKRSPEAPKIEHIEIQEFIDYCKQEDTNVSREVLERHKGKHNLQGHVKHCYYGTVRFFLEYPNSVSEVAATPGDSMFGFTKSKIEADWRDFLRAHATEIDKDGDFSFRTLRVYLPPKLGGICSGGGGGSSTLKRVFPVVARMLQESKGQNVKD